MTQQRLNFILLTAGVAALCALPLNWFTINDYPGPFGGTISGSFSALDGANVHSWPAWAFLVLISTASAVRMLGETSFFDIPKVVQWIVSLLALCGMLWTVVYSLNTSGVTLGVGALLGLAASIVLLATFWAPVSKASADVGR